MSRHDDTEDCLKCGGLASARSRSIGAYDPSVPDRVRALALDIVHRLRSVCANMPDDELFALATRTAIVELEFFENATPATPRQRTANG